MLDEGGVVLDDDAAALEGNALAPWDEVPAALDGVGAALDGESGADVEPAADEGTGKDDAVDRELATTDDDERAADELAPKDDDGSSATPDEDVSGTPLLPDVLDESVVPVMHPVATMAMATVP